jgi:sugar lactone lactonase YvrE
MINGPWDMTSVDDGTKSSLFVTNVLNGTVAAGGNVVTKGTVIRIDLDFSKSTPKVESTAVIGSGFPERTDPAALVIGPTGVGLAPDGTLYVADTLDNRVAAITKAMTRHNSAGIGNTITQGGSLFSPLGLDIAPDGDILTVNGGDGNIVESTPAGSEVATVNLDATTAPPADPGAGTLFGLAITPDGTGVYFVDDGSNTLNLLN